MRQRTHRRSLLTSALLLILAACASEPDKSDDTGTAPDDSTGDGSTDGSDGTEDEIVEPSDEPYLADDDGLDTPELTAGLVEGIENTIAALPLVTADVALASYFEATADQDPGCPAWYYDEEGTPYWYGSCVTEGGTAYEGYGQLGILDGYYDGYNTWAGTQYYGVNTVVDAAGQAFTSNGGAAWATAVTDDGTVALYNAVQGDFTWEGPAADGSWMRGEAEADFNWYSAQQEGNPGGTVAINGRLAIGDLDVQTIIFELTAIDPRWGASCGEEPAGSMSVLTADGDWLDVFFDGSSWEQLEVEPALCDGCGQAWYKGAPVGDLCLTFPALADPEHWPWPR
jgi:hypothetical protein